MTIPTYASSTHLEAPRALGSAAIRAYLREVRHDRGLSLEVLAQRVGTPAVALAGALWGEVGLSPEAAARLAATLQVDPALVTCLAERADPPARLWLLGGGPSDCAGQGRPAVVAKEGSD